MSGEQDDVVFLMMGIDISFRSTLCTVSFGYCKNDRSFGDR